MRHFSFIYTVASDHKSTSFVQHVETYFNALTFHKVLGNARKTGIWAKSRKPGSGQHNHLIFYE